MQNETPKTTTAAAFGRSSIARLPPALRESVDAAIADGATIDEITARIRAEGGACSRSAVGRYVKNLRDLIRQQQEADRANEAWVRALGERPEGRAGLILIETLRTLVLSSLADLSRREEPVSTEELARLALVLRRIEGTDKLRLERERAAAKAAKAAPGAGRAAGQAPVRKGLSPEAVAAIREVVEGRPRRPERAVTSAPVDPWNPAESQLIPLNPGESRSENVPGVSRPGPTPFESLGPSTPVQPEAWVTLWTGYMGDSVPGVFGFRAARPGRAEAMKFFPCLSGQHRHPPYVVCFLEVCSRSRPHIWWVSVTTG